MTEAMEYNCKNLPRNFPYKNSLFRANNNSAKRTFQRQQHKLVVEVAKKSQFYGV